MMPAPKPAIGARGPGELPPDHARTHGSQCLNSTRADQDGQQQNTRS